MLDRRKLLLSTCGIFASTCGVFGSFLNVNSGSKQSTPRNFVYMMSHLHVDDFALASKWGINTVLVTLNPEGKDWNKTYDAAIKT
jgi:hypothetical protein